MIKLKKNLILHDDFWSENGSLIFDYDKKILRTSFSSCICRNCFSGTECFRKEFASSKLQSTIIHENFIEIFCLFKYHIIKLIDIRTKQEYFPKVNNVLIFNDQFYEVKNLCSINVNSYIFPNFKILSEKFALNKLVTQGH